ncbi:hypothetical protein EFP20_30530 (plasmid) [Burkholderia glumae]|uniref:hypothetical protein n=1 Tax=Burkholderia glumae TaxID=337 RepID=UPI0005BCD164|nr:hypothetical protein [Burkholderia glumae]UVT05892.1 hypothetical protein EFP20_30530 [Burkholderia glumae]
MVLADEFALSIHRRFFCGAADKAESRQPLPASHTPRAGAERVAQLNKRRSPTVRLASRAQMVPSFSANPRGNAALQLDVTVH